MRLNQTPNFRLPLPGKEIVSFFDEAFPSKAAAARFLQVQDNTFCSWITKLSSGQEHYQASWRLALELTAQFPSESQQVWKSDRSSWVHDTKAFLARHGVKRKELSFLLRLTPQGLEKRVACEKTRSCPSCVQATLTIFHRNCWTVYTYLSETATGIHKLDK